MVDFRFLCSCQPLVRQLVEGKSMKKLIGLFDTKSMKPEQIYKKAKRALDEQKLLESGNKKKKGEDKNLLSQFFVKRR